MRRNSDEANWLGNFKKNELWLSLNDKQKEAVALPNKHVLTLAGAGTGKTKMLISRIAALISDGDIEAHEILAVTFTNKAAEEMKERLAHAIGQKARGLTVGTFHGVAYKWIREDWVGFGYKPNAVILDTDDQKSLVKRLYKDRNWDDKKYPIKFFIEFINDQKEKGLRSFDSILPKGKSLRYKEMYFEYERRLKEENALDFAELLMSIRDRLKNDEAFFNKMSGKWPVVLVDEFQDTNPLQYELLERLVQKGGALFAVGDDDQSIYGFRGARVENVFDFAKYYAKENVIKLEQNYRSTGNILSAANEIINNETNRMGKELWTKQDEGNLIYVFKARNEEEEATEVAQQIKISLKSGMLPKEIAILYRTNFQSRALEQAMIKSGIPYKVVGGMRFFERAEIKLAMAHARLLSSPDDVGAFCKAVSKPAQGVGEKRIDLWRGKANDENIGFYDAIKKIAYPVDGSKPDNVAKNLVEKIETGKAGLVKFGLAKGFLAWMELIGLFKAFEKEENYNERVEHLQEFVNAIAEYEERGGKFLDEFIASAVLDTSSTGEEGGVQLSTIHASKGLEFNKVFWVGLEDGLTPSEMALKDPGGESEERRLAYVAITRAKIELNLSFCEQRFVNGERTLKVPSRYFSEINPELLYPVNTSWPPHPRPAGWGMHKNKTTGRNIRKEKNKEKDLIMNEPVIIPVNMPKVTSKPTNDPVFKTNGWVKGDNLIHKRFGKGTVIKVVERDNLEVLTIKFSEDTTDLIAKFAKLVKI